MRTIVRVTLEYDHDVESPCDWGGFKLYSFSRRHGSYKDPAELRSQYGIGLQSKLRAGTAFLLDLYDHRGVVWSLCGEGMQDRWDTSRGCGILLWEDKPNDLAKTRELREERARGFLEVYTDWCNGHCYGYVIEKFVVGDDFDGDLDDVLAARRLGLGDAFAYEEVGDCWGFIGDEPLCSEIRDELARAKLQDAELVVDGDCKFIADYVSLMPEKAAAA